MSDSLDQPAAAPIIAAWAEHGAAVLRGQRQSLSAWLRQQFFAYHRRLYENRPIYLPLSSAGRSFVAWVGIHSWADHTLQTLLADHLRPALRQLQGQISDLNQARAAGGERQRALAEQQYSTTRKLLDELEEFISQVALCAERGAPPADATCPPREAGAPFRMDLDDGVMVNSAALWPLLEPQWKDPRKWWRQLCRAEGRKDYDWAVLAARYFPGRVERKCRADPSLAAAHSCLWKHHPEQAYAWELRLQATISAEFCLDEPGCNERRTAFLRAHPQQAEQIRAEQAQRRARAGGRQGRSRRSGRG